MKRPADSSSVGSQLNAGAAKKARGNLDSADAGHSGTDEQNEHSVKQSSWPDAAYIATEHEPELAYEQTLPWRSWKEVPYPHACPWWISKRRVFCEVFAGTAHLTQAMRAHGIVCLPPIELHPEVNWFEGSDVFDALEKLKAWIGADLIALLHWGTECKTFSAARRWDGGPPPIRHPETLEPLWRCTQAEREAVWMGTKMGALTFRLCWLCVEKGCYFTVENPDRSMSWNMTSCCEFLKARPAWLLPFPMCAFGSVSLKDTKLLTNWPAASTLARS